MVSREDVISAYRFILGRDPENEGVVQHHLFYDSVEKLRLAFLDSEEFRAGISSPTEAEMLNGPPNNIEVDATPEQLDQMMSRIAGDWSDLGDREPYWSVLSNEAYRSAVFSSFKDNFDATGEKEVEYMKLFLKRHRLEISKKQTCIEYGSGVGRVTKWLAREFGRVVGCDISASHLAIARENCELESAAVELRTIRTRRDLKELPNSDFLYSIIVFQHNPPPLIADILDSLLRKLNPGGIAFFQIPTYGRNYGFATLPYLNSRKTKGSIEMHVLPQSSIFQIAAKCGCSILELREDSYINMPRLFVSNTFLLQRNSQ
ncbi:MAG: class I SAM-dependent methyltransferase [Acidobacteria bacterium]|nr:class I SAM-dependent methyltransferase [Acidobacteriota bacterium]